MSTIALTAKRTGWVMPLVENPAIKQIRLKQESGSVEDILKTKILVEDNIKNWKIDENKRLTSLCREAYYKRRYSEAIHLWKKIKNEDIRKSLLNDIGWVYFWKMNYSKSLNVFDEAIKLDPYNQRAYSGRGWAFLQKEYLAEAMHDFNKAINMKDTESLRI